jgi:hypothetical protein
MINGVSKVAIDATDVTPGQSLNTVGATTARGRVVGAAAGVDVVGVALTGGTGTGELIAMLLCVAPSP